MKNLKLLIRLFGAVSLTTVAATSITACGNHETNIVKLEYKDKNTMLSNWIDYKITKSSNAVVKAYTMLWEDNKLGVYSLIITEDKTNAIKTIDKFLGVNEDTRETIHFTQKDFSKIQFSFIKKASSDDPLPKSSIFLVDKILEIE